MEVVLRDVRDDDLPTFFAQMNDPEGLRMAAFTAKDPSDRALFEAHWARIRQDSTVVARTILGDGDEVVGHAGVFGPPRNARSRTGSGGSTGGEEQPPPRCGRSSVSRRSVRCTPVRPRTTSLRSRS